MQVHSTGLLALLPSRPQGRDRPQERGLLEGDSMHPMTGGRLVRCGRRLRGGGRLVGCGPRMRGGRYPSKRSSGRRPRLHPWQHDDDGGGASCAPSMVEPRILGEYSYSQNGASNRRYMHVVEGLCRFSTGVLGLVGVVVIVSVGGRSVGLWIPSRVFLSVGLRPVGAVVGRGVRAVGWPS
jgi:hypothetical protein